MPDFAIQDYGSVVLIAPISDTAKQKVEELDIEPWQWMANGFAVDHRIADVLIEQLHVEGFTFA